MYNVIEEDEAPPIGSSLSALIGTVHMFSLLMHLSEQKVHYLLDAYYQARLKWEEEQKGDRKEKSAIGKLPLVKELTTEETPEKINLYEDREIIITAEKKKEEVRNFTKLPNTIDDEPKESGNQGETGEVDIKANKRRIFQRLMDMRKSGKAKTQDIIEASGDRLQRGDVQNIIDSLPVPYKKYLILDNALSKLESKSA